MSRVVVAETPVRNWFWLFSLLAVALGVLTMVSVPTAAFAQDEPREVTRGREIYRDKGNCPQCHGWHGDGWNSHMGNGPSLRLTALDETGLVETISCGRPGSEMPHHASGAFTERFPCYGFTDKAQLEGMKMAVGVPLRQNEIEAITAFILAELKGKEEVTIGYCERFYGANSRNCDEYRGGA